MKNKLLKINALLLLITIGCFFLYQNRNTIILNSVKGNRNKVTIEKTDNNSENSTTAGIINPKAKILHKNTSVSCKNNIVSLTKNSSILKEKNLDSVQKLRLKYENFIANHPNKISMALPTMGSNFKVA